MATCQTSEPDPNPSPDRNRIRVPFAIRNGTVVNVAEVLRGLACACSCPSCDAPLVARKGSKAVHHFAHYRADCPHALETTLHHVAKLALERTKQFWIPPVRIPSPTSETSKILPGRAVPVDAVSLEQRLGDIVPDVVITSGRRKLLVEITVTHRVTEEKCRRARKLGLSLLEIDLSDLRRDLRYEEIASRVVGETDAKHWKVNLYAEAMQRAQAGAPQLDAVRRLPIVEHGMVLHVMDCPISARVWYGRPYANVLYDCVDCQFCAGKEDRVLLCRGFNLPRLVLQQGVHKTPRKRLLENPGN